VGEVLVSSHHQTWTHHYRFLLICCIWLVFPIWTATYLLLHTFQMSMEHIARWQSPPNSFLKFVMIGSHLFQLLFCSVQTAQQVTAVYSIEILTQWLGVRVDLQPLTCWDCMFESHWGHRSFVSVGFCQVETFVMGRSLFQRSAAECVRVIEHDQVQKWTSMHILYSRQRPD
jgi:hypothetical protein